MRRRLLAFSSLLLAAGAAGVVCARIARPPCPPETRTLKQWLRALGRDGCVPADRVCSELDFDRLARGLDASDRRILATLTPVGSSDAAALGALVRELRRLSRCDAPRDGPWPAGGGERLRVIVGADTFVVAGASGVHAAVARAAPVPGPDLEGLARAVAAAKARFPDEERIVVLADAGASLDAVLAAASVASECGGRRVAVATAGCAGGRVDAARASCPEWTGDR